MREQEGLVKLKCIEFVCGDAVEERSRMRSIDDIIDKFDTSSVDGGADGSQSAIATSAAERQADDRNRDSLLRSIDTTSDHRSGGGMLTETKYSAVPESAVMSPTGSEPLWNMFGTPLSQLCRRLLADSCQSGTDEGFAVSASTETVEPRATDIAGGRTDVTAATVHVSKNLRPNVEVQSPPASVNVQPSSSSGIGVVQSNGRAPLSEGHKPPLPKKPNLQPSKPPISKKPSFGKETSAAGVVRQQSSSSSSSSPVCSTSSSTTQQQQRQIRPTSSQQTGSSGGDGGPPMTCSSAPTSPTVGVVQRDAIQQQQQQRPRVADRTPPTSVSEEKPERATANRKSPARVGPTTTCDRVKSTKSEEFLARIHRRSVSPVGTPRPMTRSVRGKSVDLGAPPSDISMSIGRRTLSKEWAVVTTTTQEEVTLVYKPPAARSASETVRAPSVTSSTACGTEGQGTVNDGRSGGAGGGKLHKTAIDNIRLQATTVRRTVADSVEADAVRCQLPGVRNPSSEAGLDRESTNSARQLDDLISSLIDIAVDVEGAQPLQPQSRHHGVVSTAQY